jgi:uncharacterized membrane protein (DUF2068 family)
MRGGRRKRLLKSFAPAFAIRRDNPGMSSSTQTRFVHGSPEHRARLQALRTVALMEFIKGLLVLAAALGMVFFVDPKNVAEWFLRLLHISPDRHFAHLLLRVAGRLSDAKEWVVVTVACSYSGLRFVEAYGLWRARAWAEWLALVSGALYLPYEVRLLVHRVSLLHAAFLIVNIGVVAFMFYLRIYVPRHEQGNSPVPPIS